MALVHSPSIVTSGLVFYYDMNNTQKSWKGAPATNLIPYSQDYGANGNFMANWTGNLFSNWINSVVTTGYQAPDGSYTANLLTGYYSRWTASITAATSTTYTFSIWLKNYGLTNPIDVHVAFGLNGGLVSYNNITSAPIASIGNWTRYSVTVTSPASGINQIQCGVDFGASKSASAGPYAVAVWGAQLETGSYATPYIPSLGAATSRSSTQAIVDLTGRNTITASSLTYSSNNTFTFTKASGNYLTLPLLSSVNTNISVSCWAYVTLGTSGCIFECGFNSGFGVGIGNSYYIESDPGNNIVVLFPSVRWISTGVSYGSTGWKNVVVTMDNAAVPSIYLNGNLIGTYSGTAPLTPNTNSYVGRNIGDESSASDRAFNGQISSVAFYNRTLSLAEIQQNFNALRGRYGL